MTIPGEGLSEQERYQSSWVSYGVAPVVSNAVAWRYSSFEAMPEHITKIVREEAPLWMKPPSSMAEVAELRDKVQTARAD